MEEKQVIKNLLDYINKRIAEGAGEDEVDKLYEDLQALQMNAYVGNLFGE